MIDDQDAATPPEQDAGAIPAGDAPPEPVPEAPRTTDAPPPIPGGLPGSDEPPLAPVAPDPATLPGGPLPATRQEALALARRLEEGAFARGIEKFTEPELRALEARIAELQTHALELEAAERPPEPPLAAPKLAKGEKGVWVRVLHQNGIEDGKGGCAMPGAKLKLAPDLAMAYALNRAVEILE